jgi:hypothetical protein
MTDHPEPPDPEEPSEPDLQRMLDQWDTEKPDRSITIADPSPELRWLVETAHQLDDESLAMVTTLAQRLLTLQRLFETAEGR